ncbi:MAG TPA: phage tail protein [Anaerolineae bacterium]|nr:phage tail protein [Anaerolineae bacterium]
MPVTVSNPFFRSDPITSHSFVGLMDEYVGGWFTECGSITVERQVLAHKEGGVNHYEHQLPGGIRRANITLKHGLASSALWKWFEKGQMTGQVERRHVAIVIVEFLGVTLIPIKWWHLPNAYPVKWSGPGLKTNGQEAAIEEVEFAYGGSGGSIISSIQRSANPTPDASEEAASDIDLPALAKKVYALMKSELQVERERLGRSI